MARFVSWLMEKLGFDGRNNVLLIVLAELPKIVNGFWREDNAKHREPHVQHDRTRRVCCLEYIILSDVRFCRVHGCQEPNARFQAPPIAEARYEQRLLAVACKPLFGSDYPSALAEGETQTARRRCWESHPRLQR